MEVLEDKEKEMFETTSQETSPFVTRHIIGGQGGDAFNFHAQDGEMLEKIGIWVGGWLVKAAKIWLTDGKVKQFGNPSGPYQEFSFQPGETISHMSLWGNGVGTRLGAIKFNTNKGRNFLAKMTDWPLKQEYPIDTGSGICMGVMGRSGSDIDSMGFIFIKPISQSVMTNVHYPTIGHGANVQMSDIKSMSYNNDTDSKQGFEFQTSTKITTKESWSVTAAVEFAFHTTVTAGIPKLAKTETGWSLKVSVQGTHGMENSKTKTESWTFPVTVPAKSTLEATLSMGHADVDISYNATVQITTTDGNILTFPQRGIYKGVCYTEVGFTSKIVNPSIN